MEQTINNNHVFDEIGFDGYLSVEREAGNDRPRDIADAVIDLRNR